MVTMTESARAFLAAALADLTDIAAVDRCFRLVRSPSGGVSLEMDTQTDEDLAFVHMDRIVLVIRRDLADSMQGRRIDVATGDKEEPALVIV
jgi:hypothetical protein